MFECVLNFIQWHEVRVGDWLIDPSYRLMGVLLLIQQSTDWMSPSCYHALSLLLFFLLPGGAAKSWSTPVHAHQRRNCIFRATGKSPALAQGLQRWAKKWPLVACIFCLALPGSCLAKQVHFLVRLCTILCLFYQSFFWDLRIMFYTFLEGA